LRVLDGVEFEVGAASILGIVGPSGCGKTTLLNIIAGVESATSGEVCRGSALVKLGYLFQTPSLIPWESVLDNALLGPDLTATGRSASVAEARRLLRVYGLAEFLSVYPNALSLGMQQRVALVRLLLYGANFLLLDEPFSRIDWSMRHRLYADVSALVSRGDASAILVTHDIDEAVLLCDDILVLSPRPARVVTSRRIGVGREARLAHRLGDREIIQELLASMASV
jgi:NitT/TauT family transport system ATP-binding protein